MSTTAHSQVQRLITAAHLCAGQPPTRHPARAPPRGVAIKQAAIASTSRRRGLPASPSGRQPQSAGRPPMFVKVHEGQEFLRGRPRTTTRDRGDPGRSPRLSTPSGTVPPSARWRRSGRRRRLTVIIKDVDSARPTKPSQTLAGFHLSAGLPRLATCNPHRSESHPRPTANPTDRPSIGGPAGPTSSAGLAPPARWTAHGTPAPTRRRRCSRGFGNKWTRQNGESTPTRNNNQPAGEGGESAAAPDGTCNPPRINFGTSSPITCSMRRRTRSRILAGRLSRPRGPRLLGPRAGSRSATGRRLTSPGPTDIRGLSASFVRDAAERAHNEHLAYIAGTNHRGTADRRLLLDRPRQAISAVSRPRAAHRPARRWTRPHTGAAAAPDLWAARRAA